MRLFISEFITGGGLVHDPLPDQLKQEGLMMLHALVHDCKKIPDLEITLTVDARLSLHIDNVQLVAVDCAHDYRAVVQQLANQHDHTWIIAPESNDTLSSLVSMLAQDNISMLNSDSCSIELCTDKTDCDRHLGAAGLTIVPSLSVDQMQSFHEAVVVKRRKGVGCEGMMRLKSGPAALIHIKNTHADLADWYVQPYILGEHKSLSLLCLDGQAKILSCNTQTINFNYPVMLTSCTTNGSEITLQMEQLANNVAQALPGLRAYVGVDFIETEECLYVIDVNPRLTSSYVGLSQCLRDNPAQLCINAHTNNILPDNVKRLSTPIEVNIVSA